MNNNMQSKPKSAVSVKKMTLMALMAAITCILGPLSIPIGPVPITFTNLAIYMSVYVLGMKRATLSYLLYMAIGLVGVPVFSSFSAGPAKLLGPTGGYLIGFIFLALIAGFFIEKWRDNYFLCLLGMLLGTLVCYAFGTAWLAYQAGLSFSGALAVGVLPFILGDAVKIVLALLVGPQISKRLVWFNL